LQVKREVAHLLAILAFCLTLAALFLRQHMTLKATMGKMRILETIGTITTSGLTEIEKNEEINVYLASN